MKDIITELVKQIDTKCVGFHYYKDENVFEDIKGQTENVQKLCMFYLQGNIFGIDEIEYIQLSEYITQILKDYVDSIKNRDIVLLLDTLDYGVRELIDIYIDNYVEDTEREQRDI